MPSTFDETTLVDYPAIEPINLLGWHHTPAKSSGPRPSGALTAWITKVGKCAKTTKGISCPS